MYNSLKTNFGKKYEQPYTFKKPTFRAIISGQDRNYIANKYQDQYVIQRSVTTQYTNLELNETLKTHNIGKKTVYIISNILSGGSRKYINDLVKNYKNTQIMEINNRKTLLEIEDFLPIDIILIQQLTYTDILPEDLLNINIDFGCKLVISLHDFCWFCNNIDYDICYHDSYLKNITINPNILNLFNHSSLIICNSIFTKNEYNRYFSNRNMILEENCDINIDYTTKRVPLIINNTINIANLQEFSEYKGDENVKLLIKKYKKYKEYKINFYIPGVNVPKYNESNWNDYIMHYKFHGLLHLNKYGETYSYALSKSINTGLPILYNNFGAFKNRIPKTIDHFIKVADCEEEFYDKNLLFEKFERMLDYIIDNNGLFNKFNSNKDIVYKDTYNFLFEDNFICNQFYTKIFNKVRPFAVYFPQFHKLIENDTNYYDGMTDITNLMHFNNDNSTKKVDEPFLRELQLKNLIDYDLSNKTLINKQIEIAKNNCIYGFATYYYWFSTNTITNKHTIMEKCYDLFFEKPLDNFKIFFIWANENWSNNPAFNTQEQIINEYTSSNFIKNIDNLIKYFKHDNYYKIDNKPVFYIHHPFSMDESKLLLFKNLLEKKCIENGFSGSLLVLNNFINSYKNFNNYNFHPNYKKTTTLDYEKYIDKYLNFDSNTNTIFFDFNNSARLCIPDKLELSTIYTNNSIYIQDKFVKKVLQQYKSPNVTELNKILLINAWNEWGENMAVEPGKINGYKYLELIKSNLLSFISD